MNIEQQNQEGWEKILGRTTVFGFRSLLILDGAGLEIVGLFTPAADDADES